jgi:hypothetical protein
MNIMQLEILLIIGVLITALTVIGYLLGMFLISMYRREVLSRKLKSLVRNHKLKPSRKLYFSDKLLVLDVCKKVAVYLDYFNLNKVTFIELEDLKDCRLVIRSLMVRLDLVFHNQSKKPISIVFYHRLLNHQALRCGLTTKAKVWNAIFMNSITNEKEFEYGISG